jgi:RNA-binding protein YlmH
MIEMEKQRPLDIPGGPSDLIAARIGDLIERSLQQQQPVWSDFLDPLQTGEAKAVLSWSSGARGQFYGGYSQAERCRMVCFPDYYISETIQPELAFLEIQPAAAGLEHRDYLGALLALGLKREKIGDLMLTASGCQVVLVPELAEFIIINLQKVGSVAVKVTVIEAEQLSPAQQRTKEIRTTVASLRLDAVAALGFGESRTRMAREIRSERVKLNWRSVKAPDHLVNPGDIVSVKGRGRVLVRELTGRSKKGRTGIVLERYY